MREVLAILKEAKVADYRVSPDEVSRCGNEIDEFDRKRDYRRDVIQSNTNRGS